MKPTLLNNFFARLFAPAFHDISLSQKRPYNIPCEVFGCASVIDDKEGEILKSNVEQHLAVFACSTKVVNRTIHSTGVN